MRLFLAIMIILIMTPISTVAHGGEHQEPTSVQENEQVSLSLETILLITILVGLVLLLTLFKIIGIEEQDLLARMALITLVLLLVDYAYIKFIR